MRSINFCVSFFVLLSATASAQWIKIKDADYVWGPFKIYNISLFSETGQYASKTRPIMLTLKYNKPVDGRDFAISLARSWSNLGITLPNQDNVVDRLRKIFPDIKVGDTLSYIALENKGYFILNDTVIAEEFNQDFNNAVVAVWLDPRVEIGKMLLSQNVKQTDTNKNEVLNPVSPIPDVLLEQEQQSQIVAGSNDAPKDNQDGTTDKKDDIKDNSAQTTSQVENATTEVQNIDEKKENSEPAPTTDTIAVLENKAEDFEKLDNKSQEQNSSKSEERGVEEQERNKQKEPEVDKKSEPELQLKDDEIYISPPMDSSPIQKNMLTKLHC
ncbi:pyruvate formate lyase-activating protein [Ursidibacter arcticus]